MFVYLCVCVCSQENVRLGAYSPVEVNVKTRGQELNCRTYIMNSCIYAPPSPQYLKVTHLLHSFPPPFYLFSLSLSHTVSLSQSIYISVIPNQFKNMDLTLNPVRRQGPYKVQRGTLLMKVMLSMDIQWDSEEKCKQLSPKMISDRNL